MCYWHLITGNQGCCQAYYSAQDIPPQQKNYWPRMSIVLRLENLMLNNSRIILLLLFVLTPSQSRVLLVSNNLPYGLCEDPSGMPL